MSRLDLAQQPIVAAVAATSGLGAWITSASEAALQLFGVPLPVVLAALTGACGARAFMPPAPFWQAVVGSLLWTMAGSFLPHVALWLASMWIATAPPPGVIAGVALVVAGLGQRAAPIIWASGGAALERFIDGLGKRGNS